MTRPSKRELERAVANLTSGGDGLDRIILSETVVGTEHDGTDLEPDETETREREIEL